MENKQIVYNLAHLISRSNEVGLRIDCNIRYYHIGSTMPSLLLMHCCYRIREVN